MDVRELALIRTQPPILVNRYELVWFKTNLYLCNVNIYLTLNRTIRYDKQLNIFGLMWRIKKRYVCIIMLFVFSMHVFANRLANNETTNNTATIVSFITSIVALIGTIVTYLTFRHKLFTDTITKERLNFIKDWRESATCFCVLLTLKNENKQCKNNIIDGHPLEYYYYKLLLMCNSNKQESYVDIEIVNLLNKLYKGKDKVSDEQIRTFVDLMQANIAIEWKGTNLESLKGNLSLLKY